MGLTKSKAGAPKESGEISAKTESLEVRRVGGELVEFDPDGAASVPDLRARVGAALSLAPARLKLCVGDRVIEDDASLSDLCSGIAITAVVITDWYPKGKYVHDGKDVLKILTDVGEGRFPEEKVAIFYTDGSVLRGAHQYDAYESGPDLWEAEELVVKFGFVRSYGSLFTDDAADASDWQCGDSMYGNAFVPPENPEWIQQRGQGGAVGAAEDVEANTAESSRSSSLGVRRRRGTVAGRCS